MRKVQMNNKTINLEPQQKPNQDQSCCCYVFHFIFISMNDISWLVLFSNNKINSVPLIELIIHQTSVNTIHHLIMFNFKVIVQCYQLRTLEKHNYQNWPKLKDCVFLGQCTKLCSWQHWLIFPLLQWMFVLVSLCL